MTTKNKELRALGWLPVKWPGTVKRLRELGIEVQDRPDARVAFSERTGVGKADADIIDEHGGAARPVRLGSYWAPRWAVLVSEAEPCNEDAREWALESAASDAEFRAALETIASLAENAHARKRMADYLMEIWTPAEERQGQKRRDT